MVGTAVTVYEEKWRAEAAVAADSEQRASFQMKTRGGVLAVGDDQLPGNQACVIILDHFRENSYFDKTIAFDEKNPLPPICYAYGRDNDEMAPHPGMQVDLEWFEPQHECCGGDGSGNSLCPRNKWSSADQGRGKACQNRRRLIMIPAGYFEPKRGSRDFDLHIFEDAKHFEQADSVTLRMPVTSVENWAKYVSQLSSAHRRPPHGVFTRVFIEPHPKTQFKVCFEFLDLVPDDLAEIIFTRHDQSLEVPYPPYTPPTQEQVDMAMQRSAQQTQSVGRVGLNGLRRSPTPVTPSRGSLRR